MGCFFLNKIEAKISEEETNGLEGLSAVSTPGHITFHPSVPFIGRSGRIVESHYMSPNLEISRSVSKTPLPIHCFLS